MANDTETQPAAAEAAITNRAEVVAAEPLPTLYTNVAQVAAEQLAAADEVVALAVNFQGAIDSPARCQEVVEFLARARKLATVLDEKRKLATEGYRTMQSRLNGVCNYAIQRIEEALDGMDRAVLTYQRELRAQAEVERKAQEKAARAQAPEGLPVSPTPPPTIPRTVQGFAGSSAQTRDLWRWRLIDTPEQPAAASIKLVPEAYLLPPEDRLARGAITAVVRKSHDKVQIPGIEIYKDESLATKAAV